MDFPCEHAKYAWLAAVLDSEGSLFLERSIKANGFFLYRIRMEVYNTNREFLEKVREAIGKGSIWEVKKKRQSFSKRPEFVFSLKSSYALEHLLPKILPYLIIKKERCKLMMQAIKSKRSFKPAVNRPNSELRRIYESQFSQNGLAPKSL